MAERSDVLRVLKEAGGPMTARQVADALGVDKNRAYYHLRRLEHWGDVVRHPGDGTALYEAVRRDDGPDEVLMTLRGTTYTFAQVESICERLYEPGWEAYLDGDTMTVRRRRV